MNEAESPDGNTRGTKAIRIGRSQSDFAYSRVNITLAESLVAV